MVELEKATLERTTHNSYKTSAFFAIETPIGAVNITPR
jgi:hypothetical protein